MIGMLGERARREHQLNGSLNYKGPVSGSLTAKAAIEQMLLVHADTRGQ